MSGRLFGSQFERSLSLNVVAGSDTELRDAYGAFVADVDAADPTRRHNARAAISESAPRFLESMIARFAAEDPSDWTAIDALGRLATTESRAQLRNLFSRNEEPWRADVMLALARVGHHDDAAFFFSALQSTDVDLRSRVYAALGLGRIGGEDAVRYLERALPAAPDEVRSTIATGLGNTRSRLAVPVLIGMLDNKPAPNEVIGALQTLTHHPWESDVAADPAAQRRRWVRWWTENGSTAPVFGPDECSTEPVAAVRNLLRGLHYLDVAEPLHRASGVSSSTRRTDPRLRWKSRSRFPEMFRA
jgi:HEAT repeat protein